MIRPGKPIENEYIERFNGRLWQESLGENWFTLLEDAKIKIEGDLQRNGSDLGPQ